VTGDVRVPVKLALRDGMVVTDGTGTNYTLQLHKNGQHTLRHLHGKIRGKATLKALKRQRQALARSTQVTQ
jgi:hypothetical protein